MISNTVRIKIVGDNATSRTALAVTLGHAPDLIVVDQVDSQGTARSSSYEKAGTDAVIADDMALTHDSLTVGVALCELAIQGLTSEPSADRTIPAYQDVLSNPLHVPPSDVDELSVRERQVFALLGAGLSNRQIGRRLDVTERTVKDHVGRILAKLG